jgi:hypothetical protein
VLVPVIAKWLASSVLKYVAWNDCMPILLQPCGAVPKGSAPFYRRIASPTSYIPIGQSHTTAAQHSSSLD